MENTEKIIEALKKEDKELSTGEISERSGLYKKDEDKDIKILKAGDKIYSPKRCYYDIKK